MIESKEKTLIDFQPVSWRDKAEYESYLDGRAVGCEFSFANLYLWGRQNIAYRHGCAILFSHFDRRSVYPFPKGNGDIKAALDSIIADASARGIVCRITGMSPEERSLLESLYPGCFHYHSDEGSYDYVYSIADLADLVGKKYHGKRNHLNRFYETYPDYRTEPIGEDNLEEVKGMLADWYREKLTEDPSADFQMEERALSRAFRHLADLEMEGLALYVGGKVIAFTLGSRLSDDTFDVHFEKARADIQGAYPAINNEFAKYIRQKFPEVRYLDREEDMGIEGLRKAKKSYRPHHQVEKHWARLWEACDED